MAGHKLQMTLIQIDNYAPWTERVGLKREPDLQILQAELYADLQRLFSLSRGIVLYARFDNMLAVTNGIDLDEHRRIQESICRRYPVTISMGIGTGITPYEAQEKATKILQHHGSSRSSKRRRVLASSDPPLSNKGIVQIAHLDVNNVTSHLTDTRSAYEAFFSILRVHEVLAEDFLKKEALSFFAGGDNFLTISNGLTREDYTEIIKDVHRRTGFKLKAGVGRARNAVEALKYATQALNRIRRSNCEETVIILPRRS